MKRSFFIPAILMVIMLACSKDAVDSDSQALEQRGNDNHKIWKLEKAGQDWNYMLTNGFQSTGFNFVEYVYGCSRPFGRVKSGHLYVEENDVTYWDISFTNTYNDNFKVETEQSVVNGDEVVRTFLYDSDHKWIGIQTEVNGEIIEDELEIGPGGQVRSYTSGGVRTEYVWKANNVTMVKTYILPVEAQSTIEKSLGYHQLGFNKASRNSAQKQIKRSMNHFMISNKNKGSFRSKNSVDEWILVFVEEQKVDLKVVQPYSSVAAAYPGTCVDGGYLNLPKNLIINWQGYPVNEDGSYGEVAYWIKYNSYKVKDNLPQKGTYSAFYADYELDEDGNYLDSNEQGTIYWKYVSGCNEMSH